MNTQAKIEIAEASNLGQTSIRKTRLFKYAEHFTTKCWKLSDKKSEIFHIAAQNIDCGYPLELPFRGGSNEYPHFMFFKKK